MSQIHIVSEKSFTDKVHWLAAYDVSKTAELYERTGFWLIFQIFRYFGFRLQENPRSHSCMNRYHVSLILSITLLSFATSCYITSRLVWKADGTLDIESLSFFVFTSLGYFITILNYIIGVANARKYSSFIRSVSSAVDLIPDPHNKRKTVSSIRRSSYVWAISILLCTLLASFSGWNLSQRLEEEDNEQVQPICFLINSMLNVVWVVTIAIFYLFANAFLIIMCKNLSALIDIYLEPEVKIENSVDNAWLEPEQRVDGEMNGKLTNHRKLSMLVEQANAVFSHFLLFSLTMEIAFCISFIKLLSIKNGELSLGAYTNTFHAMLMVSKAIACANVNHKLKSSLQLKKLPNTRQIFDDQVSYILYQTDQQNNRAEITYGNIFPVTKTFIFTIAGTALTYALVLQGV